MIETLIAAISNFTWRFIRERPSLEKGMVKNVASLLLRTVKQSLFAGGASLVLFSLANVDVSLAQSKKEDLPPKSGVLSQTITIRNRDLKVDMPWDKKQTGSGLEQQPPVSGSVSRISDREWRMFIGNNSEDTYSVSLRVLQKNDRGDVLKSDSYSYTLKAKQTEQRSVSSRIGVTNAELVLESWKNLSAKSREKQKAKEESASQSSSEAAIADQASSQKGAESEK